ncbi:hypothetical protein M2135_001694 [Parabacteroides sp. PF5-9]|nr:hypothetical protein [Parabacteroides sp. PF5-9]
MQLSGTNPKHNIIFPFFLATFIVQEENKLDKPFQRKPSRALGLAFYSLPVLL